MKYKNWSILKSAGKVAFKKIAAVAEVKDSDGNITTFAKDAYTILEQKYYDPQTGAESTMEKKLSLGDLESKKSELAAEVAKVQAELTEVDKMIVEIKKV